MNSARKFLHNLLTWQSGAFFSWLMIVLLSIAPGLILAWDWNPAGETVWVQRQIFNQWYKQQDVLAERFYQATSPEFWCRETALRFGAMTRSLIERSMPVEDALNKAGGFIRSSENLNPELIFFTTENSNWKTVSTCKINSSYLLKQLFKQISLHHVRGMSELSGTGWEQRIKSLFGKMAYSEMFLPAARMKPAPVLFQENSYYLIWDFISPEDSEEVSAGFFLLFPTDFARGNALARRIISNWSMVNDSLSGGQSSCPVVYSLLATDTERLIMHPQVDNAANRELILKFFHSNFPVAIGSKRMTGLDVPVEQVGRSFSLGGQICRLCYSDPVSGFVGMLVADMPQVPASIRLQVASWYFRIITGVWVLFAIRAVIFGRLPAIRISLRVLLWFLAFAAFPAGLSLGSQTASLQDSREVKIAGLHRDLQQQVLLLEADMGGVSDRFYEASQKVFSDSGLLGAVRRLPENPKSDKEVLARVNEGFKKLSIDASAIILVTQGGWCFSSFSESSPRRFRRSCRALFGSILDRYLKQVDPAFHEQYQPASKLVDPERRISTLAAATDFRVQENFGLVKEKFESVSEFYSGNDFSLNIFHQINDGARPFAIAVVLFNPELLCQRVLQLKLPERAVEYRRETGLSPDIAVYKTGSAEVRLVMATGRTDGFRQITRLPVERTAYLYNHDYASIMVPSQRLPGYVFVARLPVYQIEMQVFAEQFAMLGAMAIILLVVLTGSFFASFWVGRPLRDFIPDLEAIRNGREIRSRQESREDEIAATAHSIKRMAEWVAEREKIKKFVSPQAINEVLASNFIKAGAGTIRKVIILVSDIRSFTTISEEYPAEEVFDMVNSHLGAMSEIIQKWGGVIDRFVGDAVWAIFYEDDRSMAGAALAAALEMRQAHELNQQARARAGSFTVRTGTGLARGEILAGIMGNSGVRLDYTVVGRTLHEAEEAESSSKMGKHTGIVVTGNLREELHELVFCNIAGRDNLFEVVEVASETENKK
ncbi:MAG TPA: adenylate/guanylate cyclase domain-containing protein [Candidatus Rifleibacterium sp.]|nr:adenylate/guanylate cyclase domain-containing protein [Candidatus Rifleibacterium sp.]HPT45943.1 adenylate/guanylate cyclase domain-containing protein [Candidatus Rifleibacterium sp.]